MVGKPTIISAMCEKVYLSGFTLKPKPGIRLGAKGWGLKSSVGAPSPNEALSITPFRSPGAKLMAGTKLELQAREHDISSHPSTLGMGSCMMSPS